MLLKFYKIMTGESKGDTLNGILPPSGFSRRFKVQVLPILLFSGRFFLGVLGPQIRRLQYEIDQINYTL